MLETPKSCTSSSHAKLENNLYSYIQLSRKKKAHRNYELCLHPQTSQSLYSANLEKTKRAFSP